MEYQILDEDTLTEVDILGKNSDRHSGRDSSEIAFEASKSDSGIATDSNTPPKRKISFAWDYFRAIYGTSQYQCLVCQACVGNKISNLARHLAASHDITRQSVKGEYYSLRTRPSRSFIWKYCTKENNKQARCHLCNKVLYFGGGNTANITKHLKRMHGDIIENKSIQNSVMDDETMQATAALNQTAYEEELNGRNSDDIGSMERKERRGASYVWNYCEKLSRHTIRCKLCTKVMSFHGTANVITHLQRRHNVLGDTNVQVSYKQDNLEAVNIAESPDIYYNAESLSKIGRKSMNRESVVWKYCTPIGQDQVRCCFCKKNLSYQGTSNLQRHLHRMHGVVTHGRKSKTPADNDLITTIKEESFKLPSNVDFIWQFSKLLEGGQKSKCNMCDAVFEAKEIEAIAKHLTMVHAVEANPDSKSNVLRTRKRNRHVDFETSDDGNYDEDFVVNKWGKIEEANNQILDFDEDIKKDDSLFYDIIEEDQDHTHNYDEDPFDQGMVQEVSQANPLSAHSSRGHSPDNITQQQINLPISSLLTSAATAVGHAESKILLKLQEDRLRMEIEYFREKAGYYRMQKYLTALQAKKVRIELQRLSETDGTVVTTADLNGPYTVDVGLSDQIPTQ
uniref:BED-type domain-containing protein n=1 Tax=Glossina brevipalpis TaxID=37001 RepID=A0A1A9W7Y7_9MUSC